MSNNDLSVTDSSPLFDNLLRGALEVHFTIDGEHCDMGYCLTNGIYPYWQTCVKSISCL